MSKKTLAALCLVSCIWANYCLAQTAPGSGGQGTPPAPPGMGRGGFGNFDPEAMRQMMMNRLKEQLGAPDDEWKILQPRIEKVMRSQADAGGGLGMMMGMGMGMLGGRGGNAPEANLSPAARAARDLQTAVREKRDAKELERRMAAYRDAREKARQQLAQAQRELKELLSVEQEATLLNMGMVD